MARVARYETAGGPDLAPGEPGAEREDYRDPLLRGRLRAALARLNPDAPPAALEEAFRQVLRADSPSLVVANRYFHRLLADGVEIEVPRPGGGVQGVRVDLVDYARPEANDWLAVNQLTLVEGQAHRRLDVVLFVNGLPLAVVELKNPADEDATVVDGVQAAPDVQGGAPRLLSLQRAARRLRRRGELKARSRKSLVQARAFSELLEATMRRYQNRAIETAQAIEELIALAQEMREAQRRGEDLGLSEEELAFYDALETNGSAVAVLGDATLRGIAQELADTVRRNATIDWTVKERARARLRVLVRRILRKYGYPPDRQERATQTVLEQAELLGIEWAGQPPVVPFRLVPPLEAQPYENCIPLYSLAVAVGGFSEAQEPAPEAWVAPSGATRPGPGHFVAQVLGESMNRRIPNGAYCVFRYPVAGSRQGRVVLVQHREITDPDTGGRYTVKEYESTRHDDEDGGWRHDEVRLLPDSTESGYEPIVLRDVEDGQVQVIAELVEVLPAQDPA